MNTIILLAAGRGARMGGKRPKMLLSAGGRPLLYWALRNLERADSVDSVVVAAPQGAAKAWQTKILGWKFRKVRAVVDGGKERQDSTRNALRALPADCRWVGIHDGARPLVPAERLRACFAAARTHGAAILAVPCKDTIKLAPSGSVIRKTVPRAHCWAAQTPQIFRRDLAEKIHGLGKAKPPKAAFTDDASLAEAAGIRVRVVPGSYENIKVTTPEDLPLMEYLLRRKR